MPDLLQKHGWDTTRANTQTGGDGLQSREIALNDGTGESAGSANGPELITTNNAGTTYYHFPSLERLDDTTASNSGSSLIGVDSSSFNQLSGSTVQAVLDSADTILNNTIGNSVLLTGDQTIAGEKTFTDISYFDLGSGTSPTASSVTVASFQNNTNTTDHSMVTIISGAFGNSILGFGDSADEDEGYILYDNSSGTMLFYRGGTEAARFTSSVVYLNGDLVSTIEDNSTYAFRVKEGGTNDYILVTTTNGSEEIILGNSTTTPQVTINDDISIGGLIKSATFGMLVGSSDNTTSIVTTGYTTLTFTNETVVKAQNVTFDTTGNTMKVTCNDSVTKWYRITWQCPVYNSVEQVTKFKAIKNGTTDLNEDTLLAYLTGSANRTVSHSWYVQLANTNYVEIQARPVTSNSTLNNDIFAFSIEALE